MFAERYRHLLEIAKEFYFREYTCIVFKKDYVQEGLYRCWRHDPLLGRDLYVLQGPACVQRVQQEDVHVVSEASPFCLKLQGKWNRGKMTGVM
jgi:hypothetical protein